MKTIEEQPRPDLLETYVHLQVEHLHRATGKPKEQLTEFVRNIVSEQYQSRDVRYIATPSPGNIKEENKALLSFTRFIEDKVVTPSGNIYTPQYKKQSIVSKMVVDKLAERKKIKKLQLQAANNNDEILEKSCWYKQATIKINCNSLPGGFASPYNIFYDKGGYNTITSTARYMIARAYTIAEQLLGGNFTWFNEDELLNFIILNIKHMPSDKAIDKVIHKYKLRYIDMEELFKFYQTSISNYTDNTQLLLVYNLLTTLTRTQITFLFYYCNLRHIMWTNENIYRGYIAHLLDISNLKIDNDVTVDDFYKIDESVSVVVTVAFSSLLEQCSAADITSKRKDLLPLLVALCRSTAKKLNSLDELFDMFVNTDVDIPEPQTKMLTRRNTVIISDTDSVIFTACAWDDWFRGGEFGIDERSYQITSLVIYWLHHSVRFALKRFSIMHGVSKESLHVLAMKNEFLYPVMLLYDNKKTYVGIQKIQEGVVFKEPKPDIKGQTLRGSFICQESLDFIENFIIHDILYPVMTDKIPVFTLIDKVIAYENKIRESVERGETRFLKITSLKYEEDYKNPESTSVFFAWLFWEHVFSKKYGSVRPPLKTVFFPVNAPTKDYYSWLEKKNKTVFKRIQEFVEEKKKFPNNIMINPQCEFVPEELRPLIDVRSVIWHNVQAIYTSLKKLNIAVGGEKHKLLLSDIY